MNAGVDGRVLAPPGRRLVDVSARRALGAYFVLSCLDDAGPRPRAGQFYMLTAAERWGAGEDERPFLPRACSFAQVREDPAGWTLDFMLEDVGPGTGRLAELRAGDGLWLLGPLGRPFAAPRDGRGPLLVGGGVGTAPLVALRDELGARALAMLGFRDAAHAIGAELLPDARVATDDGSAGHHGLVTDLLAAELGDGSLGDPSGGHARAADPAAVPSGGRHVEVYACGPPPMLEAVRALCERLDVPAQLALESGMACGFGACFGCVVATRAGYVRLCIDGPVLDAAELERVHGH